MADIRNSQLYCAARLFEVAHRYSRGDDSRACSRDAHINKLRQSVRNVRGASNYKLSIRPKNVREASGKCPRSVRDAISLSESQG